MSIDLDRGCIIRQHSSGIRIVMYADAPGDYFDERGMPISEAVALAAGFDVAELSKQKAKAKRLKAFHAQLEREYASEQDRIADAITAGGALRARHIGGGQYAIFDGDNQVTKYALTKEGASELIEQLSGTPASFDEETDGEADGKANETPTPEAKAGGKGKAAT